VRFIALYEDGSEEPFDVPQHTLRNGDWIVRITRGALAALIGRLRSALRFAPSGNAIRPGASISAAFMANCRATHKLPHETGGLMKLEMILQRRPESENG
jgi:hypothetical protein